MKQFVVVTNDPTNTLLNIDEITELLNPILDKVECIEYENYRDVDWTYYLRNILLDYGYKISLCNGTNILIHHKRTGTWITEILHTNIPRYEHKYLIISFSRCITMYTAKLLEDASFLNNLTTSIVDDDHEKYITQSKLATIDPDLLEN